MHSSSHQPTFLEEWREFFGQRVNLKRIEKGCLSGKLRGSHVRSIIWRILLRCLPLEREEWCTILSRTRNSYNKLKCELLMNPREQTSGLDPNISNPLSLGDENPWQQYFSDCKLREFINRDVERTFPELEYFKNESVRTIMSDILFIYAKQHPDIAYKQGMHEILATLIFVLNYDQQTFAHLMEQNGLREVPPEELKILCAVNNQDFLEHDSLLLLFHWTSIRSEIFNQLMMMLERWYLAGDEECVEYSSRVSGNNSKLGHSVPFVSPDDASADQRNELIIKLRSITNDILAVIDPAMHQHLSKIEDFTSDLWNPLVTIIVWSRVSNSRPFIYLGCYIRFQATIILVINEDYSTTLQYLMRYPPVADAHSLIQYALHIKSPKSEQFLQKFEVPQTLNVTNFENITITGMIHPNRTKDIVGTKIVMEKPKQTNLAKQFSSSGMMSCNAGENRHQHGDTKSFVTKIVDTLSDRTMVERGLIRPQINYNTGGHTGMKASDEVIELLQEQVSCLQSRLNDMDMMASIVKQRIELVVNEQLPKIVGNDDLKNLIGKELYSIRSQIENAARSGDANHANVTVSAKCTRDTKGVARHTAAEIGAIEVGNEVHAPAIRPLHNNTGSPTLRLQTSRLDTEMREIRHHSIVQ
ncbi:hypothetical protein WUBG_03316 [Wuchereria bancrofti]|uniref:Rab-GAP TBC domain-containing protein n=2 Tax=Wuchereria bancrofti TaxID=6293 RepID=J9F898_WUCBA|nr:hypothetical protein WUBG_03316 [Wuchereria bancrofti]